MHRSVRQGHYHITVFTSPTPLRVGPVDVSVLVQDASSGEPIPQIEVLVRARSRSHPEDTVCHQATTEAATNKLFRAAVFDLPSPGLWDVDVILDDPRGATTVRCEMNVEEPGSQLGEMTLWIIWPAAVILLFILHQGLIRRRRRLASTS